MYNLSNTQITYKCNNLPNFISNQVNKMLNVVVAARMSCSRSVPVRTVNPVPTNTMIHSTQRMKLASLDILVLGQGTAYIFSGTSRLLCSYYRVVSSMSIKFYMYLPELNEWLI